MKRVSITILVLTVAVTALAQYRDEYTPSIRSRFLGPNKNVMGLFDPARMQMSQSYSIAFASSGDNSVMQGLYLNNIRYRLSNPLILNLQLGLLHQPYSTYQGAEGMPSSFVGGVGLDYRPSKNFLMSVSVQCNNSGNGLYPYGYYPPHSYSPFGYYPSRYTPFQDELEDGE
jgi:hypothetical protein